MEAHRPLAGRCARFPKGTRVDRSFQSGHLSEFLFFLRREAYKMENRAANTTVFVVDSPFNSALPRIRGAIRSEQLSIAAEMDAAQRVKRALDIYVPPCRVLFI